MVDPITGYALNNLTLMEVPEQLIGRFSNLITLFQAVGGFIIAYIIFNILNIFWNRKKAKEFEKMTSLLEQINRKLGKR